MGAWGGGVGKASFNLSKIRTVRSWNSQQQAGGGKGFTESHKRPLSKGEEMRGVAGGGKGFIESHQNYRTLSGLNFQLSRQSGRRVWWEARGVAGGGKGSLKLLVRQEGWMGGRCGPGGGQGFIESH